MSRKPVYTCIGYARTGGPFLYLALCIAGYLFATTAHASRIYKSIDADGNVTYSSTPPPDAVQIEKMQVPINFDIDSPPKDTTMLDEIKATAEQLEADRKQRQEEREAVRKKAEEASKPAEKPPAPEIHYYPMYPIYYYPYPGRPRPPRPPHPHPRPPPLKPQPTPLPQPHPR